MMWYDCLTMNGTGIIPLLILVMVMFGLYKLFSKDMDTRSLDTLKSRYARGEISKEEYYAIKKEIL